MRSAADRLRILTVTHNYPRFPGDPAGAFVARIAEGAAAHGHEIRVLAPHAPGVAHEERLNGVAVQRFRYGPDLLERVAYTGGLHQGAFRSPATAVTIPFFLLAFGAAVRRVARSFRPDLIHAHWWLPGGWFARQTKLPFLITCHGSDVRLLDRSGLLRRMAHSVFAQAARVTTVSEFLARDLRRLLPDLETDIVVAPMPVDIAAFVAGGFQAKAVPPRILYAGNLVRSKGVDLLLQAAAELTRAGVEYELKILGRGPDEAPLRALASRLGIDSRVNWSPLVPQSHMPAEYGASTVTVLPSRGQAEGLGLTLVEALLAGSAVVGTPAGGIPEVVRHEETGLLAREGDAQDLARQIDRLLRDEPLRERLTRAGKQRVTSTYAPMAAVGRFLAIYDDITQHHSNR